MCWGCVRCMCDVCLMLLVHVVLSGVRYKKKAQERLAALEAEDVDVKPKGVYLEVRCTFLQTADCCPVC